MTITLNGMEFYAHHGYYKVEREIGGRFTVDVQLTMPDLRTTDTDKLECTINYEQVYAVVRQEMQQTSKLLEDVAERILTTLRKHFTQITSASVRVTKHHPPLGGQVASASVEVGF